jgi:hypothetical protein
MPATNLPIPAENAAINRGELYQLTGLTASTRYQFVISATKNPSVTIAKEKALTTIQAQGNFNGTPFYFTTDAGQTSAYLLVNALEGAVITLNMKADPIPSPSSVTLPATLDPDKWYVVTGLTNGALYELAVSSDAPVTVFSKTGTALTTAVENPPLMTQAGSIQFQTTGTSAWLYVDGAFPANVSLKPFTGVVGSVPPQVTQLNSTTLTVALQGPAPAGYYFLDVVTEAGSNADPDGTLTTNVTPTYQAWTGLKSGAMLEPLTPTNSKVTAADIQGRMMFSSGAVLGSGQSTTLVTLTIPTGGTPQEFSGTAVVTFAGNIS